MKNQTESILSKKDKKLETYSLLLKQGGQLKGAEYHFDNASKLDSILIYFAQEINLGNEYEPLMGVPKYKIVFERKREISKNDFLIVEQVIKIDESGKFSLNEKYKNYQLTDAR